MLLLATEAGDSHNLRRLPGTGDGTVAEAQDSATGLEKRTGSAAARCLAFPAEHGVLESGLNTSKQVEDRRGGGGRFRSNGRLRRAGRRRVKGRTTDKGCPGRRSRRRDWRLAQLNLAETMDGDAGKGVETASASIMREVCRAGALVHHPRARYDVLWLGHRVLATAEALSMENGL